MHKESYSPIILSGPSGSGKSEIIDYIEKHNDNFLEATGMTTRQKRKIETGRMNFVTFEQFNQEIKNDMLIEYTIYNGNYYGVSKSELKKIINKHIIFNVGYSSAKIIKQLCEDSKMIYLLPPTKEELLRRLGDRNINRYQLGIEETINYALYYEFLLISYTDELERIYNDFLEIVEERSGFKQKN